MRLLLISLLVGAFIFFSPLFSQDGQTPAGSDPVDQFTTNLTNKIIDITEDFGSYHQINGLDIFIENKDEDLNDPKQYARNLKKYESGMCSIKAKFFYQNIMFSESTVLISCVMPPLLI